ncbi:MAG: lipopolysaccharide biosynthesis protein [Clostridium beijerinckii]|nr:lipopolysaccharide biosynthesis protein [Clostridium beijerinckii]
MDKLEVKIKNATKWSIFTQLCTKLISPIVNMILARIFTPEIFGVVTTVIMITTFADIFTDAGFQQYLIQHKFISKKEKKNYTDVAFWTNLFISLVLWGIISIYRDIIASAVGNSGLGYVIAIACVQLPITSFSSIQMAIYRRELNFKPLFIAQVVGAIIPLIVTIPLAIVGFGFWSLIIGNICGEFVRAIILTIKSEWKPQLYYNFAILKKMFSFSFWALSETISLWFVSWIDSFLVGSILNPYYLGLYKNSLSTVNSIMAIITGTITPIIFSSLSKLQDNNDEFRKFFLKTHRLLALVIFPIGVGLFLYRSLVTNIVLGEMWKEASMIVGISSLTLAIRIVTVSVYSDVYRAIGKPVVCLILQVLDLIIIVPTCIISLKYGFWVFIFVRSFVRFDLIIPHLMAMQKIVGIQAKNISKNLVKPIMYSFVMALLALGLQHLSDNIIWQITSIILCILFYILINFIFSREDFEMIISLTRNKSK